MFSDDDQLSDLDGELPESYLQHLESHGADIDARDIIPKCAPGFRVLIRGRAGIGKTTLSHWMLRRWSKGKWAKKYKVVFVLNLRYLARLDYSVTLLELLTKYSVYNVQKPQPHVLNWMLNNTKEAIIVLGK